MKAANVPKLQFVIPACWQTALQDNELDPICLAFKHWKPAGFSTEQNKSCASSRGLAQGGKKGVVFLSAL